MIGAQWIAFGATSGFIAVGMGAFGAHSLAGALSERSLQIYQTAAQYQVYHALALVAVGIWSATGTAGEGSALLSASGWAFLAGSVIFSGSLYTLAITDMRWLGAITPIGGLAFLIGWACLAGAAWKSGTVS